MYRMLQSSIEYYEKLIEHRQKEVDRLNKRINSKLPYGYGPDEAMIQAKEIDKKERDALLLEMQELKGRLAAYTDIRNLIRTPINK